MAKASRIELFTRARHHAIEKQKLAPYACLSERADQTRIFPETPHPYRTAFQRDRDRIIHSRAFRRLKHKRQVFLTNVGDHYRTRLTHTMEVAQIARTIARALGLNEDLTEAIAIGHDVGHTPFGHLGETVLDGILRGKFAGQEGFPPGPLGGFKHNYQSLRVFDRLESKYAFPGLNLTAPVREGILKHTRLKRGYIRYPDFVYQGLHYEYEHALTLEGQVVSMADEVAQRTHDLEDGVRAHLVDIDKIRTLDIVRLVEDRLQLRERVNTQPTLYQNRIINGLIDLLVTDLIEQTLINIQAFWEQEKRIEHFDRLLVGFSPGIDKLQKQLNRFIYRYIINVPEVTRTDASFENILLALFLAYCRFPERLPSDGTPAKGLCEADPRAICDHIAGMTDHFALTEYRQLRRDKLIDNSFDIDPEIIAWMQ